MRRNIKRYAMAFVLLFGPGSAAFAADLGTDAGTDVSNQATVDYTVNSINQTDVDSNVDTFEVDRKVDVTVVDAQGAYTDVTPGSSDRVLTYTVTNKTNDSIDILLSETLQTTDPYTGTDNFDAGNRRVFVESGVTAGFQAAEDTATMIDNLAEDAAKTVYIVSDIAIARVDGDISSHNLVATAADSGTSVAFAETNVAEGAAGNQQGAVDNVFADGNGPDTEGARDGKHSDDSSYRVRSAVITVVKSSRVISDPVNSTNPKRIPGAVLEYCIVATNSGTTNATGVTITDSIAGDPVTYVAGSIRVDSTSCTATDGSLHTDAAGGDGSDFGATAANTVTSTKATVTSSGGGDNTFRVQFRVTVN